jgi:hypothetical protein
MIDVCQVATGSSTPSTLVLDSQSANRGLHLSRGASITAIEREEDALAKGLLRKSGIRAIITTLGTNRYVRARKYGD